MDNAIANFDTIKLTEHRKSSFFMLCILFLCVFVSSQRFLLPYLHSFFCVVPLIYAIAYRPSDISTSNTLLIISIFLSVDNAGDYHLGTPAILRYVIYIVALLYIFNIQRFNLFRVCIFISYSVVLILLSLLDSTTSVHVLGRDIIILILAFIVFCSSTEELVKFKLNYPLLNTALLVFLFSELFNALFFSFEEHGYLSLDSTKALIVFPALYFFARKREVVGGVLLSLTLFVLLMYVTRMILLSFCLALFIFFVIQVLKKIKLSHVFFVAMALFLFQFIELDYKLLQQTKVTNMLYIALTNSSVVDMLKLLDPVRYVELLFFIDRDWFSVIFGEGLGTGIHDKKDLLKFVSVDDFAFSREEIKTNYFYNFHDVWIDIGLRFGCIFLFVVFLPVLAALASRNSNLVHLGLVLFVLSICSFFSTAGLILIAFLFLTFRYEVNKTGQCLNA